MGLYSAFLEVTNACNANCIHCRNGNSRPLRNEMRLKEILDVTKQIADMGAYFLILTGGEPLVRKDIGEIIACARDFDLKTLLATNGLRLTGKYIRILSDNDTSVQVSLDGSSPEVHDSFRQVDGIFNRALDAIKRCIQNNVDTSISMTVTRVNFEEVPHVMDLAIELGVPTLKIRRFISEGRGAHNLQLLDLETEEMRQLLEFYWQKKEEFKNEVDIIVDQAPFAVILDKEKIVEYQEIMKNRICGGCSAGISICAVGPDGGVRPCPSLSLEVGNIRKMSLKHIWEYSRVMNELRNRENLKGLCKECEFKNICGGCRAEAYARSHDYLAEDPKCVLNLMDRRKTVEPLLIPNSWCS